MLVPLECPERFDPNLAYLRFSPHGSRLLVGNCNCADWAVRAPVFPSRLRHLPGTGFGRALVPLGRAPVSEHSIPQDRSPRSCQSQQMAPSTLAHR